MPPLDSPLTSYSDTSPLMRVITDVISLIDPSDAPFVEMMGGLDGALGKVRMVNWPSTTYEWLEDTLHDLTDALTTASIATNTTALTVADASLFQDGQVILIDAEYMWVSAVAVATEIITVTRNFGGTQATHASTAAIEIVGIARLEGDESDSIAFSDRTIGSNFTQIFHQEVKVSRTQSQISQYGIDDEYDYQVTKAVPNLMRLAEKASLAHGQRKAGSATTPRAFGGLPTFITGNLVNAGGAVVQADFEDAAEAAYNDGGLGPWIAPTSPANVQVIKNFLDSSQFLNVTREETTAGMVVKNIVTPFGDVSILLDRWAVNSRINLVDSRHCGFLTYYPFTDEMLAKGGDYKKGEVVAELGFVVRQDNAHAAITAIS